MVKQTLEKELEGVRFEDVLGESTFIYEEPSKYGDKYELRETIPKEIFNKGEYAVMEYAGQKIREAKKGWKESEDTKRRTLTLKIHMRMDSFLRNGPQQFSSLLINH